jgi:hypothetical protein
LDGRVIHQDKETEMTRRKCAAANERFGATAGGSAALNGSSEIPPLRQVTTTLLVGIF